MTCTCLARFPIAQADRLTAIADALVPPVDVAKEDEAARKIDVEEAEAALKTALAAIEESNTTMGSAAAKTSDARQRVGETEAAVLECRIAVRKLGATGAGTGEEEPPNMDDLPGPDDGGAAAQKSAVEKLQPRELDEVRKLSRPPPIVRRALELVQTLLKLVDGEEVSFEAMTKEADWSELQAMIAAPGFVKRVVSMKPLALSMRPELLEQTVQRWPGLMEAVGKTAAKRAGGFKGLSNM